MLGVFLDRDSLDTGDLNLSVLEEALPGWRFFAATEPEEVAERIAGAQVVVSNKVPLTAEVIEAASDLQFICVAATGTNNVDLEAARARGVIVSNVRGYATPSVVQHVFALILALTTRLTQYREAVAAGRWQESSQFCLLDFPIAEIAGRTLGIVGYGELGQGVARVAQAFGMQVRIAVRPGTESGSAGAGERRPLHDLLPELDVLTLHCPLTEQTRGLIGAQELARLPDHALLINTARGGIVEEQALADALRDGRLGGAGIDVLSVEPPAAGNPLLAPDIPNLIVTPHIAWASRESRQRMLREVAENVRAFATGTPRNRVV